MKIVNDGLTDTTKEIAEKYKSRLPYISQLNQGPAAARNLSIKTAKSRSFYAENILFPDALRVYQKVINRFNAPPFILSRMICFTGNDGALPHSDQFNKIECLKHLNSYKKRSTIVSPTAI